MTAILLFAKAPRAGSVKRRLSAVIGDEAAVAAYRAVGRRVALQVAECYPLTVWYDPPDAEAEMRRWLGAHEFRPQVAGDLGQRLGHAFDAHFALGGRDGGGVVALGADAPDVNRSTIEVALEALEHADVVVGPALDGGYYLLGLRRPVPELFVDIPWGTASVLQVTMQACERCHLVVRQLETLRDLDTAADLEALGLGRP